MTFGAALLRGSTGPKPTGNAWFDVADVAERKKKSESAFANELLSNLVQAEGDKDRDMRKEEAEVRKKQYHAVVERNQIEAKRAAIDEQRARVERERAKNDHQRTKLAKRELKQRKWKADNEVLMGWVGTLSKIMPHSSTEEVMEEAIKCMNMAQATAKNFHLPSSSPPAAGLFEDD